MAFSRFINASLVMVILAGLFLAAASQSRACTGVEVKTTDGSVLFTRTMEFGFDFKSNLLFFPRGQKFSADLGKGWTGKRWKNAHAYIGFNIAGTKHIADGMNEKGLYVGGFYFPGFAEYQPLEHEQALNSLNPVDLGDWILGSFANVDQVKKAMAGIRVVNAPFPPLGKDFVMPMHCIVVDRSGAAIVLEYTKGKLQIYDNPVGVVTNSPPFDWQMINLRNYVNLSAVNVPELDMKNLKLSSTGQGSGMLGLPGDFTPPSRFVRAVALSQSAKPVKTAAQGVNLAWHIINNIDIFIGAARDKMPDGSTHYDYTQWTSVYDLTNALVYFRTYENLQIKMVDMNKLDPEGGKVLTIPVSGVKPQYPEVTGTAK